MSARESENAVYAEALLARADDALNRDRFAGDRDVTAARCIAEAQVYATLAVAEALSRVVYVANANAV